MVRIDAASLVAAMAQDGALWDRPVANRPGVAVRQLGAAAGDPQAAIAVLGRLALPDQAARQRVAAGPLRQPLGRRQGEGRRGTCTHARESRRGRCGSTNTGIGFGQCRAMRGLFGGANAQEDRPPRTLSTGLMTSSPPRSGRAIAYAIPVVSTGARS